MSLIWQAVLGIEKVGIEDNFFSLGGDSIKAIQVLSRLNNYGLKLEMRELFKHPVIKGLSGYVTTKSREIDQVLVEGEAGLTPVQNWLFEQSFTDKHHFNQAVMLHSKEEFKEDLIRKVFAKLVEHHDALRMVIKADEGKIIQYNRGLEGEPYSLKVIDVTDNANYQQVIEKEADSIQASIDLYHGHMLKAGLFKTKEGDHLLIAIHHLVVDGVSWRISYWKTLPAGTCSC